MLIGIFSAKYTEGDLTPQLEEFSEVCWYTKEEINSLQLTPLCVEIFKKFN